MNKDSLKKAFRYLREKRKPSFKSTLVMSRRCWDLFSRKIDTHLSKWSQEELDQAELHKDGLIGERNGVKCYITKKLQ